LYSLVAPIALYPDPLLAQVLTASTPLEIVQLQQWLAKNENLNDKELADAVAKQPSDLTISLGVGMMICTFLIRWLGMRLGRQERSKWNRIWWWWGGERRRST
jgi:hypothetical protein